MNRKKSSDKYNMKLTTPIFDKTELENIKDCLDSGWVTQGPFVARFEKQIASEHKVKYAIATTSCTAALHLSVIALGIKPGDEVIVPAFTWITSASCVEYVGAKVIFSDVDPDTYNIDPDALLSKITDKTKAIIVVHLFGFPAPMDEIMKIARDNSLMVIEDAACAIGASYKGKMVGNIGNIGCFSFHPRKIITTGEGGAITTDSETLAKLVTSLRNHGSTGISVSSHEITGPWSMAEFPNLGFNYRMSDIQASIGVAQMGKLKELVKERRRLAEIYNELLCNNKKIRTPRKSEGHTYQSYVIKLADVVGKKRNMVMSGLENKGIETRPGTHAVHRLTYYRNKYNIKANEYPNASNCEDTTITLPLYPNMKEVEQNYVVNALNECF